MPTRFIERMAVECDGEGEAVLMIHGLGGTSNVWTPVLPALVAAPDASGRTCPARAGRTGWRGR